MPDKLSAEEIAKLPKKFRKLAQDVNDFYVVECRQIWRLLRWVAEHHQEEGKP